MSSVDAESLTREKEKEGKTLQTLAPHSMEPNTFHQGYASYSRRADAPGPCLGQVRSSLWIWFRFQELYLSRHGGTDEPLCSAIRCYGFEEDYMDVGGFAQKALKHKRSASSSQAVSDTAVLPYCIGNKAGGQIVDKTTWHQLSQ